MKLWIVSQDTQSIFQANNIIYYSQNNRHTIIIKTNGCFTETLGEYSSKKRCAEVIEEITMKLMRAKTETVIYKMPKD